MVSMLTVAATTAIVCSVTASLFGSFTRDEEPPLYGRCGCSSIDRSSLGGCSRIDRSLLGGCSRVGWSSLDGCSGVAWSSLGGCSRVDRSLLGGCSRVGWSLLGGCSRVGRSSLGGCSCVGWSSLGGCSRVGWSSLGGCSRAGWSSLGGCSRVGWSSLGFCSRVGQLSSLGNFTREVQPLLFSNCIREVITSPDEVTDKLLEKVTVITITTVSAIYSNRHISKTKLCLYILTSLLCQWLSYCLLSVTMFLSSMGKSNSRLLIQFVALQVAPSLSMYGRMFPMPVCVNY